MFYYKLLYFYNEYNISELKIFIIFLQKMFPFYEGWLISRSVGTCGLVTVNRHSMKLSLYQLYNAPWKKRLDVAIQVSFQFLGSVFQKA